MSAGFRFHAPLDARESTGHVMNARRPGLVRAAAILGLLALMLPLAAPRSLAATPAQTPPAVGSGTVLLNFPEFSVAPGANTNIKGAVSVRLAGSVLITQYFCAGNLDGAPALGFAGVLADAASFQFTGDNDPRHVGVPMSGILSAGRTLLLINESGGGVPLVPGLASFGLQGAGPETFVIGERAKGLVDLVWASGANNRAITGLKGQATIDLSCAADVQQSQGPASTAGAAAAATPAASSGTSVESPISGDSAPWPALALAGAAAAGVIFVARKVLSPSRSTGVSASVESLSDGRSTTNATTLSGQDSQDPLVERLPSDIDVLVAPPPPPVGPAVGGGGPLVGPVDAPGVIPPVKKPGVSAGGAAVPRVDCTAQQIQADTATRDAELARDRIELSKLQGRARTFRRDVERYNADVDAFEAARAEFMTDVQSFSSDVAQYAADSAPPHGASTLFIDRQHELEGRESRLKTQLGKLQKQLQRLTKRRGELEKTQKKLREDIDAFAKRVANYSLPCADCSAIRALAKLAKEISLDFPFHFPNPVAPAIPGVPKAPALPEPPRREGGRVPPGLPAADADKHECHYEIDHSVDEKPLDLWVRFDPWRPTVTGQDFGGHPGNLNVSIFLSAFGVRRRKVDVKAFSVRNGQSSDAGESVGEVPLGEITYSWKLESFKITDPLVDQGEVFPPETDLQPLLEAPGPRFGREVSGGAIRLVGLSYWDLYVDWEREPGTPGFEGKLLDFEVEITCTAHFQAETMTRRVTLVAEGVVRDEDHHDLYRFELRDGGDPLQEPSWSNAERVRGETVSAGITLGSITGPSRVRAAESCLFALDARALIDMRFVAEDQSKTALPCKKATWDLTQLSVQYYVHWQANCPAGMVGGGAMFFAPDAELLGRPAFGEEPTGPAVVTFMPPDVSEETQIEISATVQPWGSQKRTTAKLPVTVVPRKDMMDWYTQPKLLEKLVSTGVISDPEKEAIAISSPLEPENWTYSDVGLKALLVSAGQMTSPTEKATSADVTAAQVEKFGQKAVKAFRKRRKFRDSAVDGKRFLSVLPKDPLHTFELSKTLPPQFQQSAPTDLAKLTNLKRPVVAVSTLRQLGKLLPESTGEDYFFKGGWYAEFSDAVKYYSNQLYYRADTREWQVPDATWFEESARNSRLYRLRQSMAVRINEIIKTRAALEAKPTPSGKPSPLAEPPLGHPMADGRAPLLGVFPDKRLQPGKFKLVGEPRIVFEQTPAGAGELHVIWSEETKAGVRRLRATLGVETEIRSGVTKVTRVGRFLDVAIEAEEDARKAATEQLARLGAPSADPYGPDRSVRSVLDMKTSSLGRQCWKNWAIDTAWKRTKGSGAFGAAMFVLTDGHSALVEGYKEAGVPGALRRFGVGLSEAAASALVRQFFQDFAQRCVEIGADYATEKIVAAEERFVASFEQRLAKQAARDAANVVKQKGERVIARQLIKAGRIPFIAARWVARGSMYAVPVVGLAMVLLDVADLSDVLSREIGLMIWSPPDVERAAWRDPLYTLIQKPMTDHVLLLRGIQYRATDLIDTYLDDPNREQRMYVSLIEPRATRFVFKDGTELEIADEVIGPRTEWLPRYVRDRLPELPDEALGVPELGKTQALYSNDRQEPYKTAQDPLYFYDFWWNHLALEKARAGSTEQKVSYPREGGTEKEQYEEQRRVALAHHMWGRWRDTYATHHIRLKFGDSNDPSTLWWWRDFKGGQHRVLHSRDGLVMETSLEFEEVLKRLEVR